MPSRFPPLYASELFIVALIERDALNGGCSDMNHLVAPPADLAALAAICSEAAQRHGDNWGAVKRHIEERVVLLPKDQRERLAANIQQVLRYCCPEGNSLIQ